MPPRIEACLRCGSTDLKMPSIGAGDAMVPGADEVAGVLRCARCGFRGAPVVFETRDAAELFRARREVEGWEE